MNGDGMGGLALAIGVAMLLMIAVPAALLAIFGKRFGAKVVVPLFILGAGGGVLAVIATFYESVWSPPVLVLFEGTPKHELLFIVEDPKAAPLEVKGLDLPLVQRTVRVSVPENGVAHVQSLAPIQGDVLGGPLTARLNGRSDRGYGSQPGVVLFDFGDSPFINDVQKELEAREPR